MKPIDRLALAPLLLVVAGVLCACAVEPTASTEGDGRERITASDQSEADRRARVRLELATAYFGRGQLETALDQVKLALASKPDSAEAYNLRGLIYASLNDNRLADESFRRALQINPREADAMHNYGWFLCQRQRFTEAAVLFEQAIAQPLYAGLSRSLMAHGVCQARNGQLAEAERSLARSYELDPSSAVTAVNLSEVLYRRGEFERARFYIRRVNSLPDVSNAQTLWLATRIERRLGNAPGVREFGSQLRNRFPQSPEALAYDRGRFDE